MVHGVTITEPKAHNMIHKLSGHIEPNKFIENLNAEKFFMSLNPDTTESFKDSVFAWGIAIFGLLLVFLFIRFLKGRLL